MKKYFLFLHKRKTRLPPCNSSILHRNKQFLPTIALFCMQVHTHFPLLLFVEYFESLNGKSYLVLSISAACWQFVPYWALTPFVLL